MKIEIVSVFLVFIMIGCKNEISPSSSAEEIYFNDYQSPENKWGYIDISGAVQIQPQYDNVRDFKNGKAAVNLKGKWGVINKKGDVVVPFTYRQLSNFSEGRVIGKLFENSFQVVDEKGAIIFSTEVSSLSDFSSGYYRFMKNGYFGYLDDKGHVKIESQYVAASDFKDGYAIVSMGSYGVINKDNERVIPLEYKTVLGPIDQLFGVKNDKGWRLLTAKGQVVLDEYFSSIEIVSQEDIILIDKKGDIFHYSYSNGKITLLPYDGVIYGGMQNWHYYENGFVGVLNKKLDPITPAKYELIYRFEEGYAGYSFNDMWGYLDLEGNEITPGIFPLVWNFKDGFARVIRPESSGFINKNFEFVIPKTYREVRDFSEGLARVQIPN